ncbi:uncharacterized protein TRIVIDRAFT_56797 [Trichoderma virens Gv29-8]|uniref:Ubiquitin carboxyl-terminal hydrolase n=1 Tax=Hypocrea virens (strain Gv29-8 / FGSC 10586) TaxID=413071 RepID=G9NAA4_HYPVG|nr:uncharacterized protein TRIVIDRAFT_56797 [Trichoderma virens Gv29-8]EHK16870.1 hypothetical protein TRIVIDRAFT_56797 [Trichoderma virens Gv29-8]
MPDKTASVVSYAAGASLAAAALIYVFGPTFTIDHDTTSSRKKTIVGLRNQANDCFINSVLQALAGLGELRVYLIRETHRRRIEDPAVYANLVQPLDGKQLAQWKLQGLQDGLVTHGLKEMLDALNERPISKKAISPFPFVKVLEIAFKQRISRQQQDAQEFLQIVAERLKDEYHAGQRARMHARKLGIAAVAELNNTKDGNDTDRSDDGFPLEGKYESHIQCQTCGYTTKPREETFCSLTLAVPQVSSTTLNACFDGIFKTEYIDDFKCEMCRLVQTRTNLEHEMAKSTSESFKALAQENIEKLKMAIALDPERPPEDVELGDIRYAPKRRIAKTTRMSTFPRILAIHLSRSIYGIGQVTQKNSAKVSFPEQLPLGSVIEQRKYKLLGVVTHRGGHNSGHYEAFRRQNTPSPYANINTFQPSEIYSKTPTPISTPQISALRSDSPSISTPDLLSPVPADLPNPLTNGKDRDGETNSLRSVAASTKSALSKLAPPRSSLNGSSSPSPLAVSKPHPRPKKRKPADKWWRVSDEKVREAKTSEVLGMQKEVYLLFYELESEE